MAQPLTDAIEALTTYANTVTGASDTTLSDAVATLADGYGGGGGANWITDPTPTDSKMHLWLEIPTDESWTVNIYVGNTRGTIDFGDGSLPATIVSLGGVWGAQHTYTHAGCYKATVNHDSGGLYMATRNVLEVSVADHVNPRNGLLRRVYFPSSAKNIMGQYWAQNHNALVRVDMPTTVTTSNMGQYCFTNAYLLESINIPEGVARIDQRAFENCGSLYEVTIPSTVTEMQARAFNGAGTRKYHVKATTPPTIESNTFGSINANCIIYVPYSEDHSILTAYQTANNWSAQASKMQEE